MIVVYGMLSGHALLAQLLVLAVFVVLMVLASKRFRAAPAMAAYFQAPSLRHHDCLAVDAGPFFSAA